MKHLLFLLLGLISLQAQSFLVSAVPLPKTYVLDTEAEECNNTCLYELIENEQYFSFLARAKDKIDDPALNDILLIKTALFNVERIRQYTELKIAMLLPYKVIGRYAYSTTNAAFAYYLTKNRAFELKTYHVESEESNDLEKVLAQIEEENFHYVIAPLTLKGAHNVTSLDLPMHIYFPTIHKSDMNVSSEYTYFGGINYKRQLESLMPYSYTPLTVFYDKNNLGRKLTQVTEDEYRFAFDQNRTKERILFYDEEGDLLTQEAMDEQNLSFEANPKFYSFAIAKRTSNLQSQLDENMKIQNGSFLLNTPVVKSAMVMSQLTLYDVNASNILSTQTNYNPELLLLTQPRDREKMYIANSINFHNNVIIESNALLRNNIVYDWINYATTIGADYFYHLITSAHREYPQEMVANQIEYPISIVKPTYSRFVTIETIKEEFFAEETEEESDSGEEKEEEPSLFSSI
jgi:SRSO17 transposase